jgi:hypothetical protein
MKPFRHAVAILLCLLAGSQLFAATQSRMEGNPDPKGDFDRRFLELGKKKPTSVKGLIELAQWCEVFLLFEQREKALRQALEYFPNDAQAHYLLGEVKCGQEWLPIPAAFGKDARENEGKGLAFYGSKWLPKAQAEKARAADRAKIGWEFASRCDCKHMTIYAHMDSTMTRCYATLLENAGFAYEKIYGGFRKMNYSAPLTIYLFPDASAMRAFGSRRNINIPSPFGFYDSGLQTFMGVTHVDGLPEKDQDFAAKHTVVHEMTHALDQLWAGVPVSPYAWINEGPAEYMGGSRLGWLVVPGYTALASAENASTITSDSWNVFVPRALNCDLGAIMSTPRLDAFDYPISGLLVHFLMHGDGGKYRARYVRFLQGPPDKRSPADLEAAIGMRIPDLQVRFREHVSKAYARH